MSEQEPVSIEFAPNGPALVKGKVRIKEPGGWVEKEGSFALCRCGHSKKKPYCDGSHRASDFKAE